MTKCLLICLGLALLPCCSADKDLNQAQTKINAETLAANIKTLASDEFEGRQPSSRGEEMTVNYLKEAFKQTGLQPGNGDSYFQEVPLVAITANSDAELAVNSPDTSESFRFGSEFIAWTKRVVGVSSLQNSELVFVGYGIVAPEFGWNDYAGLNVKDKTVVMLVNDPGFATQDEAVFRGNAMTYYGRWTYKFEEAARQGAAGAFIIHETQPAGYPWEVVVGSWSGRQFALTSADNNLSRCAVEGWLTAAAARKMLQVANHDFDQLREAAAKPGFKSVPLGLNVSLTLENDIQHSRSRNVVALLPGVGRADECIFYLAHWDHFGKDTSLEGDQIFNGAFDNATGVAGLLEIAGAFTALENPPLRSIVFLAVTAEEQGLLGSSYYTSHPIYPRSKTIAAINMDGLNVDGRMKDITVVGYGNSELDDYLAAAANRQGRKVRPDPEPEKGYFYRSDHFSFAKVGIPALYTDSGIDHVAHGTQWTLDQRAKYTAERYHKPSDEFDPDWDLSGAVEDLQLLFEVGYRIATSSDFPNWRERTEFRAKRDADLTPALQSNN